MSQAGPNRAAPALALTGLFIAAASVIDVALLVASARDEWPGPAGILAVGSALGQIGLIGAWLAMGGDHWVVRIIVSVAIGLSLAAILSVSTTLSWAEWASVSCVFAALITLPLILLRSRGFQWRPAGIETNETPQGEQWQYSLGGLLGVITVIGVGLAVARRLEFPWAHTLAVSAYVAGFVATAHLSLWAAAGEEAPWVRAIVVLVAAPLVGLVLAGVESQAGDDMIAFATAMAVEAGWIYAGVLVQRMGGYRLIHFPSHA